MKQKNNILIILVNTIASFFTSAIFASSDWNSTDFKLVRIISGADGKFQNAYFHASNSKIPKPLLVSLHTWSDDYAQEDTLSNMAVREDWNYIHPDFRGPNRTADACLSNKALTDIDDAIQFAMDHGNVDTENIFVVGLSGGGYATLEHYLKSSHKVKAFLSWVPISDLVAWYYQSKRRNLKYANDILNCISSGKQLDVKEAKRRSPLYFDIPATPNGTLEIYAGIHDGHDGSVPVSHSINFYNRLVTEYGFPLHRVKEEEIIDLLTMGIELPEQPRQIEGRNVIFEKKTPAVSLTIFEGGHEMLPHFCFERLKQLSQPSFGD